MSPEDAERNELLQLCGKVSDNQLTNVEQERLETLLKNNPRSLQFYRRFMMVCSGLEQLGVAATSGDSPDAAVEHLFDDSIAAEAPVRRSAKIRGKSRTQQRSRQSPDRRRPGLFTAMTAAALLAAAGLWFGLRDHVTSDPGGLVVVVSEFRTVWSDGFSVPESRRLPIGKYVLHSGASQLRFDNGVELLVQAPSVFSVDSEMQATLETGSLTLYVPEAGSGFRVETPLGTVIDRGTRIGIMTDDESGLEVHVFEGRAETAPRNSSANETLVAGQAAAFRQENDQPITVTRMISNQSYFADSIDRLKDLPQIEGDLELLVSPPRSVRRIASELVDLGHATIFAERQAVVLEHDLKVTWTQPGPCPELTRRNEFLSAGTQVDTFLVHLTVPRSLRRSDQHLTADGTITFPRPVLAFVTHEPGKMSPELLSPHTDYPSDRNTGLEDSIDENTDFADRITLSEDRMRLTFHLNLHGRPAASQEDFIDQFRVLIQSEPAK